MQGSKHHFYKCVVLFEFLYESFGVLFIAPHIYTCPPSLYAYFCAHALTRSLTHSLPSPATNTRAKLVTCTCIYIYNVMCMHGLKVVGGWGN